MTDADYELEKRFEDVLYETLYENFTPQQMREIMKYLKNKLEEVRPANQIIWYDLQDEDDNLYFEGNSPYQDGDGHFFKWRLRKKLFNNRIVWYEDHDKELGESTDHYDTLEEAKTAVQKQHETALREVGNQ